MVRFLGRHKRALSSELTHKHTHARNACWLAWPTLSAGGGGQIKAAGVYYHKDAVKRAIARFGPLVMARLNIEPAGKYAGAVRITVGGTQLGSIPHGLAAEFRNVVEQLHKEGLPATCRAELEAEYRDEEAYVDVFPWVAPTPRSDDEPFLPPGLGSTVRLADGQAECLDESLHSRAKSKRMRKIGELTQTEDGWLVALDGHPIGMLEPGSSASPKGRCASMRTYRAILGEPSIGDADQNRMSKRTGVCLSRRLQRCRPLRSSRDARP